MFRRGGNDVGLDHRLLVGLVAIAIGLFVFPSPPTSHGKTAAEPLLSEEFAVSEPRIVPALGNVDSAPSVATNGSSFLATWYEDTATTRGVRATRIGSDGSVIDVGAIEIGSVAGSYANPQVVWSGDNYGILWAEFGQPFFVRVSPEGTVLDEEPIDVGVSLPFFTTPRIAGSPHGTFIVWAGLRNIRGVRLDQSGAVLDDTPLKIAPAKGVDWEPTVAWGGSEFLVAWSDEGSDGDPSIFAARVLPDGTVLDPSGLLVSENPSVQASTNVAWDGSQFMVVWSDRSSGQDEDAFLARVSSAGEILDPVVVAGGPGGQRRPNVSAGPAANFVVWHEGSALWGQAFDDEGIPIGPGPTAIASDSFGSSVSSASGVHLVAFNRLQSELAAVRFDETGNPMDESPFAFRLAWEDQFNPAVAWNGVEYLAVWSNSGVWAARIGADGVLLDPDGIQVWKHGAFDIDVTWTGSHYLVVWEDPSGPSPTNIYAARLTSDGTVLDESPIRVSRSNNDQLVPSVASNGRTSLVVWDDSSGIVGALVDADGNVSRDEPGDISMVRGDYRSEPSLAWNGSNYLVAWAEVRTRKKTLSDIFASRVSARGRVRDLSGGISVVRAPKWQDFPSVATNGDGFLVSWSTPSDACDVYAATLSAIGEVKRESIQVAAEPGCQGQPTSAWMGSSYVVAWPDRRIVAGGISAKRVGPRGVVLDPEAFSLAMGYPGGSAAVDATSAGAKAAVIYAWRPSAPEFHGALRAFVRTVGEAP